MMSEELEQEFRQYLKAAIADFGLEPLNDEQTTQLVMHYGMLRKWNKRINLTRIVAPNEAATLHYAESLFGARFIGEARSVLDIGSGAGFPAIPLAVAKPEVHVTALEANQKKSLFLKEAKDALSLDSLEVVTARLEEFDWSSFELLTSRALDRAESVVPSIVDRMNSTRRLMLYCSRDLVGRLAALECKIETHAIPLSDERVVAIIRPE
jgi:16S rRNA (guanine527-N7)-methyltransferase